MVSPALAVRRAACLAEIARARLHRGEPDDPATLEPVYLHGPAAERRPVPAGDAGREASAVGHAQVSEEAGA